MACPCCSSNCCDEYSDIEIVVAGMTEECTIANGTYTGTRNQAYNLGAFPYDISYSVACQEETTTPNGPNTGNLLLTAQLSFRCDVLGPLGPDGVPDCAYSFRRFASTGGGIPEVNGPFVVSCVDRSALPSVIAFDVPFLGFSGPLGCASYTPAGTVTARLFRT